MDAQTTPAIAIDQLVKRYKGVAAVDGISFRLARVRSRACSAATAQAKPPRLR